MATEYDLTPGVSWPTVLYSCTWKDHAAEAPGIIEYLYQVREKHDLPIASGIAATAKSRQGLFESAFDLFDAPHPKLTKLKIFITEALQLAVSHVNGSQAAPQQIRPVIVDSWFHITNDGGFHDAHVHDHCSWCGIYYVQAGNCSPGDAAGAGNGVNRFYSPLAVGGAYNDYGNRYLRSNRIDIVPRDGLLVLFPSYLMHSALPYRGAQDRIVISFNSQAVLEEGAMAQKKGET